MFSDLIIMLFLVLMIWGLATAKYAMSKFKEELNYLIIDA